ncbi:hypothetical protein [Novosphingobium sp.]|uniref:hypothetical protein n=1 Tax=Novosphingobium sp. TaxID=1874826 RepID=UPI0028AE4734|nr:hypothetical protein [Novosphingobium sp.]
MNILAAKVLLVGGASLLAGGALAAPALSVGRVEVATLPFAKGEQLASATYTPSGRVLVAYQSSSDGDPRDLVLVTMKDDGSDLRPLFAGRIPDRPKDNGIRYMVFADDRRVFLGDFVLECEAALETCGSAKLIPVAYPPEVAGGEHIAHRWSEMVIAPDNRHVAWTTLFSNFSAALFTGELRREADGYRIVAPRVASNLEPFAKDPRHADGVIPLPVRGGEVKQFVHGGTALSLVGAVSRDLPDSVTQDLATGAVRAVTDTPGYTETTIFSPDERLGVTMTTRFSPQTDPAVLGLLPRPYPASLNMGLSMFAYTYAVTGVRTVREGNVGPALIDITASQQQDGYLGTNLGTEDGWVFNSPISWHPGSRKAMWVENRRGSAEKRIRIVQLPDYRPGPLVKARPTPVIKTGDASNMAIVPRLAEQSKATEVKVYGRVSGHIDYSRAGPLITKTYVAFSDDGINRYDGRESTRIEMGGLSTYEADVRLAGPKPGEMKLKVTFGPLAGERPSAIVFTPDAEGKPLSAGYAAYDGRRLEVAGLLP